MGHSVFLVSGMLLMLAGQWTATGLNFLYPPAATIKEVDEDDPVGKYIDYLEVDVDATFTISHETETKEDYLELKAVSNTKQNITLKTPWKRKALSGTGHIATFDITATTAAEPHEKKELKYRVIIRDVNDHYPIFDAQKSSPALIFQKENNMIAEPLFTLYAYDREDDEMFGTKGIVFKLKFDESQGMYEAYFRLESQHDTSEQLMECKVYQNKEFDYETTSLYRFEIVASDNEGKDPTKSSPYPVTVNVLDVDDSGPVFTRVPPVTRIKENLSNGTDILRVEAVDGDRGIMAPIKYSIIEGNINDTCEINSDTGVVKINKSPDREAFREDIGFTLVLLATENSTNKFSTNVSCTVIVEDVNDCPPVFNRSEYKAKVDENSPNGIALKLENAAGFIEVTDADEMKHAGFKVEISGVKKNPFIITPMTGALRGYFAIQVNDSDLLDFETLDPNTFELKLIATDESLEDRQNFIAEANLTISVNDVNDNWPIFSQGLYNTTINEKSQKGLNVIRVEATDNDLSSNFGTDSIRYSFLGISDQFEIDEKTGNITVKNGDSLDRKRITSVYLTVEAKDNNGKGNSNTTQVIIELKDINDNAPRFLSSSYKAVLEENEEYFQVPLTIKAEDDDEGDNKKIEYNINENEKNGTYFSLKTTTEDGDEDEQLLIPKQPLDYEEICPAFKKNCSLEVIVTAKDKGVPSLSTEATIKVTFMDINDERPKFDGPKDLPAIVINETVKGSSLVVKLNATDKDISDEFRKLTYKIEEGSNSLFAVDVNGTITTGPRANLSLSRNEFTTQYNLKVVVTDGVVSSDADSSVCHVTVNISDVNNEAPTFSSPNSKTFIYENATVNTMLTFSPVISASDVDVNSQLVYDIVWEGAEAIGPNGDDVSNTEDIKSLFKVNSKGEVLVNSELDRETVSRLTMKLQVIDTAAETEWPLQTATATLTVTIGDVNDNAPTFEKPYYSEVMENSPIGTKIEPVVTATDPDDKENGKIFYSLDGDAKYLKLVNISESGRLTVASNIDREEMSQIVVLVVATDKGLPPMSSNVTYNITVLDQNDNDPVFKPNTFDLSISEDATVESLVIKITAEDADAGDYGTVVYLLPNKEDFFGINSSTGEVFVKSELDCDSDPHEEDPSVTVVVEARDNKGIYPNRAGRATVNIIITDVNDNAPRVDEDSLLMLQIDEDRREGSELRKLKAVDPDKGANGSVILKLDKEETDQIIKDLFDIKMETNKIGRLLSAGSLLGKVGVWKISITADDFGTPPLQGNKSVLVVNISDINDHAPEFHHPKDKEAYIIAAEEGDKTVTTINVTDADHGENADVSVTLSNFTDVFAIGKDGYGYTLVLREENPEGIKSYEVSLKACDNGKPQKLCTSISITVIVKKSSVNPPTFENKTQPTVYFTEEENPYSETSTLITAIDPDTLNQQEASICYFIVDGDKEKTFILNQTTNLLEAAKVLDRELKDSYMLKVLATKNCKHPPESLPTDEDSSILVNVVVKDINDNVPSFGSTKLFTGGVDNKVKIGEKTVAQVNATDADIGDNAVIYYYKNSPEKKYNDVNMDRIGDSCFLIANTSGDITTGCLFAEDMKGYVEFEVLVNNTVPLVLKDPNAAQFATAIVKIYILRVDQKLKFTVFKSAAAFNKIKDQFISKLTKLLEVTVNMDDVQIYEDATGKQDKSKSDIYVHFVDPVKNEVLEPSYIQQILDNLDTTTVSELNNEFSIISVTGGTPPASGSLNEGEKLKQILFLAGAAAVAAVLVVLLSAYCFRVKRLERKLKAATTTAFDNKTVTDSPTVDLPTTNLHAKDGSNPLWNYEFDGNDPRLFESNDTDSIISGENLVEDDAAFDGGKNNGGFPAMMESFFVTDINDEPTETSENIEMKNQLNSNFSMKRPDQPPPAYDNFTMKQPDDAAPTSDNFIFKKREEEMDI